MARSRWIVSISVAIALVLVVPTLVLAQAGRSGGGADRARRVYRGKTSQNQGVFFRTVKNDGNWGIEEADFDFKMRCEDGTKFGFGTGIGFGSPVWLDSRNRFAIDDSFFDEALHIHGRLGANAGSGTVEVTLATLTQDEQAQTCTCKERDWSVQRVPTTSPNPTPTAVEGTPSSHLSMHITVDARGQAHVTRPWS